MSTSGEERRDLGTSRAAAKRPTKTMLIQLAILERVALGQAITIDDVLPVNNEVKRSNHVGAAMLSLSKRKLIRQTGERRRSRRSLRHSGTNPVWIGVDARSCYAEATKLRSELQQLVPPAKQGELFGDKGGAQ